MPIVWHAVFFWGSSWHFNHCFLHILIIAGAFASGPPYTVGLPNVFERADYRVSP
jgi:hypothetical protein